MVVEWCTKFRPLELYGVPTKRLNEQVKRNSKRFPEDFMFQLMSEEKEEVVAKCDHLKTSVLNSERAMEVNIQIVRIGFRRSDEKD
jgi:ORF6N domain